MCWLKKASGHEARFTNARAIQRRETDEHFRYKLPTDYRIDGRTVKIQRIHKTLQPRQQVRLVGTRCDCCR